MVVLWETRQYYKYPTNRFVLVLTDENQAQGQFTLKRRRRQFPFWICLQSWKVSPSSWSLAVESCYLSIPVSAFTIFFHQQYAPPPFFPLIPVRSIWWIIYCSWIREIRSWLTSSKEDENRGGLIEKQTRMNPFRKMTVVNNKPFHWYIVSETDYNRRAQKSHLLTIW